MADPIQSIVSNYQQAVAAIDAAAIKRLTDSYLRSYELIRADATALINKMATAPEVTKAMIYKSLEYKRVMNDIQNELARYGVQVDYVVAESRRAAVINGTRKAEQMILDMFPKGAQESINAVLQRMPTEAVQAMVGALQTHSLLAS